MNRMLSGANYPQGKTADSRANNNLLVHALCVLGVLLAVTIGNLFLDWRSYFFGAYLVFCATLLGLVWAVLKTRFGDVATELFNRFAVFMERRGSFRSDAAAEAPKFALIRMAFGAFMVERVIWIMVYMRPSEWADPLISGLFILYLVASCLVALGLFTQFALVYLVCVQWQLGDIFMDMATLGNDIAASLAVLLIFANAGAHYSLDGILRKRRGILGRITALAYYQDGIPSDNTLQLAKFLTLLAYACVCFYSLMMHLGEPAWMDGTAGPLLLTNNFMTRYPDTFFTFFELGPWAVYLGRIALWAMLPWYLLIIPFVLLGGVFRAYIIGWAVLFFCLSLFILQLGWLAEFEFLFFAGLFWQKAFIAHPKTLQIAYDDRCNLCDRTTTTVKYLDWFGRVELKPLSENQEWIVSKGIDPQAAMHDLYGVEARAGDRLSHGYDLYITLTRNVFLLLPAYPILLLGKVLGVGPMIYRFVADRRTRLFGVCQLPGPKPEQRLVRAGASSGRAIAKADPIVSVGWHIILLSVIYLVMVPAPFVGWQSFPTHPSLKGIKRFFLLSAGVYGLTPINVFNKTDLRMSENWFTVTAVFADGSRALVPFFDDKGNRLSMHNSDLVYFGHTVKYRRQTIGREGCVFDDYSDYFKKFAVDYTRRSGGNISGYLYTQYHQANPPVEGIYDGRFMRQPIGVVCEVEF